MFCKYNKSKQICGFVLKRKIDFANIFLFSKTIIIFATLGKMKNILRDLASLL
jgi:hypothetical protein